MSLYFKFYDIGRKPDKEMDREISKEIHDIDSIYSSQWQLQHYIKDMERFPKIVKKINYIVREYFECDKVDFWKINRIGHILDDKNKKFLIENWLSSDNWEAGYIIVDSIEDQSDILKAINKAMKIYSEYKDYGIISSVSKLFQKVNERNIEKASKILSDGTPAIKACLLSNEYLPDKYVVDALKSLSKLKIQREIKAKIDFNLLTKLAPKTRLDTFKQLLNLGKYYAYYGNKLPFKVVPTVDEVRKLLFPCSIKHNEEVATIVAKYKTLVKENH